MHGSKSIFVLGSLAGIVLLVSSAGVAGENPAAPANAAPESRVPEWTADARWYYVKIPRFRNGDKSNDPDGTLAWTDNWPPLETDETAPREKSGETLLPHARMYGGDLRGVINSIPYLKKLGVNAICLSPPFHGSVERKVAQIDLRHVDDAIGVKGGFSQTGDEGADPKSWVWTSSDKLLRELIHGAHEQGMRVVVGGVFSAVMTANSPPSELESYYLSATRRWMDPDGDGNPLDGVDGWLVSIEEGPLRQFDEKFKAFWLRWRNVVWKTNPNAVVITTGTLALGQLKGGPFDIALHSASAGPITDFFGIQKTRKSQSKALLDAIESSMALAPEPARLGNITDISGAYQNGRLLTELATSEPLWNGGASHSDFDMPRPGKFRSRQVAPGPLPDDAARARWKLATILQHCLPGAPITWYGDEVGMFGGPGDLADAPTWWSDSMTDSVKSTHYRKDFFALVQWLHRLRAEYPALRKGKLWPVIMDDANKVLAISRSLPDQEVILVINYGDAKQLVMLPAGKPGQMVGVRNPHLVPPRGPRKAEGAKEKEKESDDDFPPLSVAGARQFVGPEGKIRMWMEPMSVRFIFIGAEN